MFPGAEALSVYSSPFSHSQPRLGGQASSKSVFPKSCSASMLVTASLVPRGYILLELFFLPGDIG